MKIEEKNPKTLVLVCHENFCPLLDRVLRAEGLTDYQHGDLSLVGGSFIEPQVGGATEVFVVSTHNERANKLIRLLRACPVRGETEETFELYTVGD